MAGHRSAVGNVSRAASESLGSWDRRSRRLVRARAGVSDRASALDTPALQALRDVGGDEFDTLVWWVEDEYPRAEAALVAVRQGAGS